MAPTATKMRHGTVSMYTGGRCRCDECRQAMTDYCRERRGLPTARVSDEDELRSLLIELFPYGLTDDAPLASLKRKVAA